MTRIAIDPITRIEGHLRIEVQVDGGAVSDAWASATMFRGIELILKGRDPRDAWTITQRACGVCTTVHALASVRSVEDALGITVPSNARILRNLIQATQYVQDHVIHFYHLHALDWVDVVSALERRRGSHLQTGAIHFRLAQLQHDLFPGCQRQTRFLRQERTVGSVRQCILGSLRLQTSTRSQLDGGSALSRSTGLAA